MGINRFFGSNLRTQLVSCTKYAAASRSPLDHVLLVPFLARSYSTGSPLRREESTAEEKGLGFKGHDMLAPFTAGWQSTDLHPLIIEKSEGCYVYDSNGKKYLDALAGLWCTALGVKDLFPYFFLQLEACFFLLLHKTVTLLSHLKQPELLHKSSE